MSGDDLSFGPLLDRLRVPDHSSGFWGDLEAQLAADPSTRAFSDGATSRPLRSVDTEIDANGDDEPITVIDPRRRARRLTLALNAAAAIVAAVIGLQLFGGDEDPPTITDVPSTTTLAQPDEDAIETIDGAIPSSTNELEWTGLGAGGGPDIPSSQGPLLSWVGSQFATYNFDKNRPPIEVSTNGRVWGPLRGLPGGFEPRWIAGWRDSLVVSARESPLFDETTFASFALSEDVGATWQLLPEVGPPPPASPYLSYRTGPGGMAVIGDTIVLSTSTTANVDVRSALIDSGIAFDESSYPQVNWIDREWSVRVCGQPAQGADCPNERIVRLTDLGVDVSEMPAGRGESVIPQFTPLYRSNGGSAFEQIELDEGIVGQLIAVVADQFVIASTTSTISDDGVVEFAPTRIWRSADGVEWTSSPLDVDGIPTGIGGSVAFAQTDDELYTLRDDQVIRSLDLGRTWDVVPTPGAEVYGIEAGPSGVLLSGRLPQPPLPTNETFEREGYTISLSMLSGIEITDPDGVTIVQFANPSFEAPEGAPVLVQVEQGAAFYELQDAESGQVILTISSEEVRDMSGLRSGEDCDTAPVEVVAWSPDGFVFEWQLAGEAFGDDPDLLIYTRDAVVGDGVLLAWVNRRGASRAVDFRGITEGEPFASPVDGQPTVCSSTEGTYEAFIAELG